MLRMITLVLAWLLWSGHYTFEEPLIAAFGVFSCAFAWWLDRRMRAEAGAPDGYRLQPLRLLVYLPWLLKEIVKANLQVARIVLDPKLPIEPRMLTVRASQRGDSAKVLFANSITLTPGTISLDLRGDTIRVHALSPALAGDLAAGGEMDRRCAAVEVER